MALPYWTQELYKSEENKWAFSILCEKHREGNGVLERMKERERKERRDCELLAGEPEDDDMQASDGG